MYIFIGYAMFTNDDMQKYDEICRNAGITYTIYIHKKDTDAACTRREIYVQISVCVYIQTIHMCQNGQQTKKNVNLSSTTKDLLFLILAYDHHPKSPF